jgi:hypothetical protein
MDEQGVVRARVDGWDHIGLTFDNETHVADQRLVEDGIDHGAVVDPALRLATNDDPRTSAHGGSWPSERTSILVLPSASVTESLRPREQIDAPTLSRIVSSSGKRSQGWTVSR